MAASVIAGDRLREKPPRWAPTPAPAPSRPAPPPPRRRRRRRPRPRPARSRARSRASRAPAGDRVYFDTDQSTLQADGQRSPRPAGLVAGPLPGGAGPYRRQRRRTRHRRPGALALGAPPRRGRSASYLVSRGVEAGRISTISYGQERPIDLEHDGETLGQEPATPRPSCLQPPDNRRNLTPGDGSANRRASRLAIAHGFKHETDYNLDRSPPTWRRPRSRPWRSPALRETAASAGSSGTRKTLQSIKLPRR